MPIPSQTDMFGIVLDYMADGRQRSRRELMDMVADGEGLTPDERRQKTGSGKPLHESRVGWSIAYLHRAKLLDRVSRGVYRINDAGHQMLASGLSGAKLFSELQRIIAEKDPWNVGGNSSGGANHSIAQEQEASAARSEGSSPDEAFTAAMEEHEASLASELIDLVLERDPAFLEQLVVDLLVKMGYGSGATTQYVGDGGIDGIITTDTLGFDPIYTQAKRYAPNNTVGKPEIQKFAGALGSVKRGVFITTSTFSDGAIEYARHYPHATIVLINGKRLAELMIAYGLGVTTVRTLEIKQVDLDYFERE